MNKKSKENITTKLRVYIVPNDYGSCYNVYIVSDLISEDGRVIQRAICTELKDGKATMQTQDLTMVPEPTLRVSSEMYEALNFTDMEVAECSMKHLTKTIVVDKIS